MHGHHAGDLLLVEVGNRLTQCVRGVDTAARIGGDEFVVMLGELDQDYGSSIERSGIVAEKIRATLAEPYILTRTMEGGVVATVEHHCTASIGVALFIDHQAGQEDVLKWADLAMYQAKQEGRNIIRYFDNAA